MPNALGLLADPRGEMRATPRNKLMGLLADALSAANDYAQRPDPTMPGGKANPVLGLLADAASLNSLATTAQRVSYGEPLTNKGKANVPFLRPETADVAMMAPISPRNALAALGMVGGMADNGAMRAATVWHGSPHKFDKFDASKIGTGSGVDAQGVGMYFSDAKRVADAYAQPGGAVYAVDIPDDQIARMLQWQEPVAKQPRDTRKGVLKALGRDSYKDVFRYNATGSDVYNNALAYLPAEDAARLLAASGIPGVRYSGNGTTNTVVFPGAEDMLTIVERR